MAEKTPTPEWAQPGKRAWIIGGYQRQTAREVLIERHTATRIVLADGTYFSNKGGADTTEYSRHVGGTWGSFEKLVAHDDERVTPIRAEARKRLLASRIDTAHETFRRAGTTEAAETLRAAVDAWLANERQS